MKGESPLLQHQLDVIAHRWPGIYTQLTEEKLDEVQISITNNTTLSIDGIQLTSAWDREAEARLQAEQIPPEQPTIYLYGSGLGDCARILLQRESLDKLHVIILNRAIFLRTLEIEKQHWISDLRVNLHLPPDLPEVHFPFLVNPAELLLAEEKSFVLRDRLELELNQTHIQQQHRDKDSTSQKRIATNRIFLEKDEDIASLPPQCEETIFVAAAGPTLENHFKWLAENRPTLITVDAAVSPLLAENIIPDIVVSIDAHSSSLFDNNALTKLQQTPLVYLPAVDNELLERWRGKRYYSCSTTPMFAHLPKQFKGTQLFSSGSVIHPAVDLARQLGAQQVVLLGADFSFVGGKSHASSKNSDKNKISLDRATHFVINSCGEKVPTLQNFKGYLRDLERYIEKHPQISFLNGSREGAKIMGTKLWKP